MNKGFFTTFMLMMALSISCKHESPTPEPTAPSVSQAAVEKESNTTKSKVAKIVFIGQKEACECTRKRVDGSLAALEEALAGRTDIPVEKLNLDVDEAKVEAYQKLGAIMVAPAVYLLDSSGKLIEMLQGEITVEQILIAIGG